MKKTSLLALFAVVLLVGCTNKQPEVVVDADTAVVVDDKENEVEGNVDVKAEIKERNAEDADTADEDQPAVAEEGDDLIAPAPEGEDENTTVYIMDTTESSVNWEAGKVIPGGDHAGTVTIKAGQAVYTNSKLTSAEAVLDMTTIKSDSENLDEHLKNEDFFDVENHPEATIVITSTELVEDEEGDYTTATADLTIKGITNEITFPVYHDEYWDVANITIDRTLWDIKYGSKKFFDDLKDRAIKDEITFEVNIAYE